MYLSYTYDSKRLKIFSKNGYLVNINSVLEKEVLIMYELKDYLKAINFTKNLLDTDDTDWSAKKYPPYVINKCLSMHYDTYTANE